MNFRDKLDASAQEKIQENWPKVQQVFREKIGPAALEAAKNDDQMRSVFKMAHQALPFPVRMVVKEDAFIQFCFAHRDNLLPKGEATSTGV
jgi:hypothetical protein